MALVRFDVISDTHGYLSSELLEALQGANYIVHAGDITSNADYQTLQKIAPVKLCLGNNDFCYNYGPMVKKKIISLQPVLSGRYVIIARGLTWSNAILLSVVIRISLLYSVTSGPIHL